MIVITAEIESGLVAKADLVQFRCSPVPRARHHSKRRRQWMGVKGITRNECHNRKCSSARRLRMVQKAQGPLVKVLLVPGSRSMKQLAVRVHFLRCNGLLHEWFVKSLIFM
ncbi:hypothetical protein TNCV_3278401 [Trichonephila clavipes]|nr:hypothetical protein TNCV_3278401 [Trichonephila clavipes]